MKKLILLLVLILAVGAYAQTGQSDTTTLHDYMVSFLSRSMSGYTTPWDLDPDSSNIRQAINDALLDISTNPVLGDATSGRDTVVIDTPTARWYDLPEDFFELTWASMADPTKNGEIGLEEIQKKDIGKKTSGAGQHPKYYVIDGRQIYFDPNNSNADTVFIYYRPYSTTLADTDSVSNVVKKYKTLAVDMAIINFFSGRSGGDVARIIANAKDRIAITAAKLGIKPESVVPDVK
jgi:hypothetical protein